MEEMSNHDMAIEIEDCNPSIRIHIEILDLAPSLWHKHKHKKLGQSERQAPKRLT